MTAASAISSPTTNPVPDRQPSVSARALAAVRILLGAVFLWAFADKLLGLGFATPAAKAWISGGSPTAGYLGNLKGWFAAHFASLAAEPWVEWAFMLGLLLIGSALLLGVALRAAAVGGTLLMALMWLSALPLKTHPVIDEHVVYAAVMVALAAAGAGRTWGLAPIWDRVVSALPAPLRTVLR